MRDSCDLVLNLGQYTTLVLFCHEEAAGAGPYFLSLWDALSWTVG